MRVSPVQLDLMQLLFALHIVDIDLAVEVREYQIAAEDQMFQDRRFGHLKSEVREVAVPLFSLKNADRITLQHDEL